MFNKIKNLFKKPVAKKWRYEEMTMREMSDYELSQVVGQAGGLFLTDSFGFTVGEEVTNEELRNLINSNLSELNNLGNPVAILNVYMAMAKVMSAEQVNEFTKIMIEQMFKGALQEIKNLCEIAGLKMTVHNYSVNVTGNFKVEFH